MNTRRTAVVIGSGPGGLLVACLLAQSGYAVTVLERLDIPGGRFTHIDFEGYAVPTGAFHMLPGGPVGPIGRCLRHLGIDLPMRVLEPSMMVHRDGACWPLNVDRPGRTGFRAAAGLTDGRALKWRFLKNSMLAMLGSPVRVGALVDGLDADGTALRLYNHLTEFSLGATVWQVPLGYKLRSLRVQRFGREAMLLGGNKSLIDALCARLREMGGVLQLGCGASRIAVERSRAVGVVDESGALHVADVVICTAGSQRAVQLLGAHCPQWMRDMTNRLTPFWGAAWSIRSDRPLQRYATVDIPLRLNRISGITAVSLLAPDLCPKNHHYSLAYQRLDPEEPLQRQLDEAREELLDWLPTGADPFHLATYVGEHPGGLADLSPRLVNRLPLRMPDISGLYFGGYEGRVYGVAAEVTGEAALRIWRMLR